jgi:glucose-1-phosphate adenylyltransferase
MDYRPIIAFHQRTGADATLGVFQVPIEETHRFGTVTIDHAGRIEEFREKSSIARSNLASMGIYIFKRDTLARRLREDAGEPGSLHDFGYNVLPRMVKTDRVFAYEFKGYWLDIGTVKAYYDANMELLPPRPRLSLDGTWPILRDNTLPPAYSVSRGGNIINSLISAGCVIRGRVENSVLSPGVRVAEHALVRNAIIMADTSIGYHSIVDGCILDERVIIGDYCYVGFGAGLQSGSAKITVLGSDVTVPDHTAIGRQCRVPAGLGPEAFDTRLIPSGTAMAGSLAEREV